MKKIVSLICLVVFVATLTACGGSSTDPVAADSATISGVVADGYLVGAIVCSDQNNNKVCDAGEPSTVTELHGLYELTGSKVDIYPVLVEVEPTVVDEDTTSEVGVSYVMSAPIPNPNALANVVITPITTLVQAEIDNDSFLTVDEAAAKIRTQLGVADDVDVLADFVAAEGADYDLIHATARVVAGAMADAKSAIETTATGAGYTPAQIDEAMAAITKMVVADVMQQLVVIVVEIKTAQAVLGFDPATFPAAEVLVVPFDTTNVAGEIETAIAPDITSPVVGSFRSLLEGDGLYWVEADVEMIGTEVSTFKMNYGVVAANGDTLAETEYSWDNVTSAWVTRNVSSVYQLVNGIWVLTSEGGGGNTFTYAADNSITVLDPLTESQGTITILETDISGTSMATALTDHPLSHLLTDGSALFPAGSKVYSLTFEALNDEYRVYIELDKIDPTIDYSNVIAYGVVDEYPTSLAAVKTTFVAGSYDYLGLNEGVSVQFDIGGVLNIFNNNSPVADGTFEEVTVQGQTLLMLHVPAAYKLNVDQTTFLVEWTDETLGSIVKKGKFTPAGGSDDGGGFSCNSTTFNAVGNNLSL